MSQKSRNAKDANLLAIEEALNLGTAGNGRDSGREGPRTARPPADGETGQTRRPVAARETRAAIDGLRIVDEALTPPPAAERQPPRPQYREPLREPEPARDLDEEAHEMQRHLASYDAEGGRGQPAHAPQAQYAPQAHVAAVHVSQGNGSGARLVQPARASHGGPANRRSSPGMDGAADLIASMRHPASFIPFVIAGIAGLIWLLVAGLISYANYCDDCGPVMDTLRSGAPSPLGTALLLLAPPAFLFVVAALVRRTLEMGRVSRTLAEVATRLTEPAAMANESIISVSQAMRSEVAAMDVALERAVGRATELEVMVRTEVGALERAYEENEGRVRSLVEEMRADRKNVLSHAEQLRAAISGAHDMLQGETEVVSDRISRSVGDAAERLTETFNEQGQQIAMSISSANDVMIDSLTERSARLLERFEKTGAELGARLGDGNDRLVAKMTVKAYEIQDHVARITAKGAKTLAERAEEMAEHMRRTTGEVVDLAAKRTSELHDRLAATTSEIGETLLGTGSRVIESIAASGSEVHQVLQATGSSVSGDIAARGQELVGQMSATGTGFIETLKQEGDAAIQRMEERGNAFFDAVLARGSEVDRRLDDTAERISAALNTSGARAVEGLAKFQASGEGLAETLARRGDAVVNQIEAQGSRLVEAVDARSAVINATFEDTARRVSEALEKAGTGAVDGFARFQAIGENLSEAIGKRGEQAASALEARGALLIEAADARSAKIGSKLDDTARRLTEILEKSSGEAMDGFARFLSAGEALSLEIGKRGELASTALDLQAVRLLDAADARNAKFDVRLEETARRLSAVLEKASGEAAEGFANLLTNGEALSKALGKRSEDVASAIEAHGMRLLEATETRGARLDAKLDDTARRLSEALDQAGGSAVAGFARFLASGEALSEALGKRGEDVTTAIEAQGAKLLEASETRGARLDAKLDDTARRIAELLEKSTAEASEGFARFHASGEALSETIFARGEQAAEALEMRGNAFLDAVLARSSEADRRLDDAAVRVTQAIDTSGRNAASGFAEIKIASLMLSDSLARRGGELAESLAQTVRDVTEAIRGHADSMNDRLSENGGRVFDAIVARGLELDRRVAETGGRVTARIEEAERSVQANLTAESTRLITALDGGAARASQAIATAATESAGLVERTGTRTAEALRHATTDTLQLLERTGGDVAQSFAAFRSAGEALAGDLTKRSSEVMRQLDESHRQFAQSLAEQQAHSAARIGETETRLGEALGRHVDAVVSLVDAAGVRADTNAGETAARLEAQVARLAERFDEAGRSFTQINANAAEGLGRQITALVASVDEAGSRMARELAATSDGYTQSLDKVRAEMAEALEKQSTAMAERLESRSEQAMAHIVASTERLNDTLTQFSRLASARLGLPLVAPNAPARLGTPGTGADLWLSQHLTERAYAGAAGTALHLRDSSAAERLQPELARDERLLWAGRPSPSRVFKSELAWLLVAGLMLVAQAVAYGVLAYNGSLPIENAALRLGVGIAAGLAGLVGLGLIITERVRASRAKATLYGLTTQRILVLLDREGGRTVDSLPLAGIGRIEKHLHPDTTGTLILSGHGRESGEVLRLVGIEDAPAVEGALRQVACAGRPLLGAF